MESLAASLSSCPARAGPRRLSPPGRRPLPASAAPPATRAAPCCPASQSPPRRPTPVSSRTTVTNDTGSLCAAEFAARAVSGRGRRCRVSHLRADRYRPAGQQQPGRSIPCWRSASVAEEVQVDGHRPAGRHAHRWRRHRRRERAHRGAAAQRAPGDAVDYALRPRGADSEPRPATR